MSRATNCDTESIPALTSTERGRLRELEKVIGNGVHTFVQVGLALAEVRDSRLYRESYPNFEAYCVERWKIKRAHAHRLIEAAEVAERLPLGDNGPLNERQARELAKAPEELRPAVMEAAGENPTAARLADLIKAAGVDSEDLRKQSPREQAKRISEAERRLREAEAEEDAVDERATKLASAERAINKALSLLNGLEGVGGVRKALTAALNRLAEVDATG